MSTPEQEHKKQAFIYMEIDWYQAHLALEIDSHAKLW